MFYYNILWLCIGKVWAKEILTLILFNSWTCFIETKENDVLYI